MQGLRLMNLAIIYHSSPEKMFIEIQDDADRIHMPGHVSEFSMWFYLAIGLCLMLTVSHSHSWIGQKDETLPLRRLKMVHYSQKEKKENSSSNFLFFYFLSFSSPPFICWNTLQFSQLLELCNKLFGSLFSFPFMK